MCGTAMRGADALPGSKATSLAKGSHRNLGDLISDPLAMCLNGPCREGQGPTPAMYGGEKSDRAIVAMKPANKAERSAAELVERRARAEGSAVQRYTRVGHSAGVGAPIAGLLRVVDPPLPKVGAVCGKAARTVLCGGRSAMSVPTAMRLPCCDCSQPLMALSCRAGMSAITESIGGKQTYCRRAQYRSPSPTRDMRAHSRSRASFDFSIFCS